MDTKTDSDVVPAALSDGPTLWFIALAAALGTATIYPLQPAIAEVAGSLDSSVTATGVALACGPVGYLVGLGLLVPLVDRFPPRKVLAIWFAALAVALAVEASAPSVVALGAATGAVGLCSSVGAGLSSVAGRFASANRRATVLGIVTAGISAGILAGRIVGGWLAEDIGWRGMLLVFATACALIAAGSWVVLPHARGTAEDGYLATLKSLPGLFVRHAALRLAALCGALWFFAFCALWSGLAVALSEAPYSYSAEQIGLFALAGVSGILATRVAGTWTDRIGARPVILAGLTVAGVAAGVSAFTLSNTAVILVCLALFDAGLFAAQVANQSTVLSIDPAAPARYNSGYMLAYFVGGSLGTAFGSASVEWLGWPFTVTVAVAMIAAAALITGRPRTSSARGSLDGGVSLDGDPS